MQESNARRKDYTDKIDRAWTLTKMTGGYVAQESLLTWFQRVETGPLATGLKIMFEMKEAIEYWLPWLADKQENEGAANAFLRTVAENSRPKIHKAGGGPAPIMKDPLS